MTVELPARHRHAGRLTDGVHRRRKHRLERGAAYLHRSATSATSRTVSSCTPGNGCTREAFGPMVLHDTVHWLEPPWKAILSNKAILAVLWELFPDHPNLLRTEFAPRRDRQLCPETDLRPRGREYPGVPSHGRLRLATAGPYDGPCVYQDFAELPCVRWEASLHRQLDRQRLGVRRRHPRGRHDHHRESQPDSCRTGSAVADHRGHGSSSPSLHPGG